MSGRSGLVHFQEIFSSREKICTNLSNGYFMTRNDLNTIALSDEHTISKQDSAYVTKIKVASQKHSSTSTERDIYNRNFPGVVDRTSPAESDS